MKKGNRQEAENVYNIYIYIYISSSLDFNSINAVNKIFICCQYFSQKKEISTFDSSCYCLRLGFGHGYGFDLILGLDPWTWLGLDPWLEIGLGLINLSSFRM
mmetsp:Transcript_14660/g.16487  ORF Transcript_14660/g.16487 Transcript_14660/m.16487 type:complete len:102 (-) Transcript_14660:46-351(-)